MSNLQEQLEAMQAAQFNNTMNTITLVGNLTNWRTNFKNNSNRLKILHGQAKIFGLLSRFKVPNRT